MRPGRSSVSLGCARPGHLFHRRNLGPDDVRPQRLLTVLSGRERTVHTGQMWLPELGMYHYKARIYSPTLGRFLQTDPIGYEDSPNLYAYAGNDPINLLDPMGEQACGLSHGRPCPPPKPPQPGDITVKGKRPKKGGKGVAGSGLAAFQAASAATPIVLQVPKQSRNPDDQPDKDRSACAAGLVGGVTGGILLTGIEGVGAGLLAGEIAGGGLVAAGLGVAAVTGGIAFIAVGVAVAVYVYDQNNNNATADAINRNTGRRVC